MFFRLINVKRKSAENLEKAQPMLRQRDMRTVRRRDYQIKSNQIKYIFNRLSECNLVQLNVGLKRAAEV